MNFNLEIDKEGIWQKLQIFGERENETAPDYVWDDVGEVMLTSVTQNIRAEGRPKWPAKKHPDGRPLLGGEAGSIAQSTYIRTRGPDFIEIESGGGLAYAIIQSRGGQIKQIVTPKQARFFYAKYKESNVPSRKEMWLAMYIKYRSTNRRNLVPPLVIDIESRAWMMFQREDIENIKGIFTDYFLGRRE